MLKKDGNGKCHVPDAEEVPSGLADGCRTLDVWLPGETKALASALEHPVDEDETWVLCGLRASFAFIMPQEYKAAGKAFQILYWDKHSHYCPACDTLMRQHTPIMKKCPQCGYESYPPIATAIIVLVRKGDEILMVHARNFRGNFYGLVAGFLEAGETLEECVEREVMEETGLRIKNITYFGSQPWPYPSGLMAGFVADYAGGEITYNYKQLFGFHASAVYRNWSTPSNENAAYAEGLILGFKPALEADVRIDASPMQALRFSLGYRHIGRCEVDGEQADAVSNLYLSAHYELFRDILVYARLNNLLNKNYQYYEGCPAQGINFLGGVSFRF